MDILGCDAKMLNYFPHCESITQSRNRLFVSRRVDLQRGSARDSHLVFGNSTPSSGHIRIHISSNSCQSNSDYHTLPEFCMLSAKEAENTSFASQYRRLRSYLLGCELIHRYDWPGALANALLEGRCRLFVFSSPGGSRATRYADGQLRRSRTNFFKLRISLRIRSYSCCKSQSND